MEKTYVINNKMKWENLNIACMIYLIAWALIPSFAFYTSGTIFRIFYGIITIVWILTGIQNTSKKYILDISLGLVFLLIMGLYYLLEYGDLRWTGFLNYILLIGVCINGNLYVTRLSESNRRRLLSFSLLCIFVTTITTLSQLLINSNASRWLTSSSTNETIHNSLQRANVGSFDFIYGILILLPILILSIKNAEKYVKLFYVLLSFVIVFCIIKSNFTTAYILLLIAFAMILMPKAKSLFAKVCTLILLVILFALAPMILNVYFEYLMQSISSIYSRGKLEDLTRVINGTMTLSETTSRFSLLLKDINSFWNHPIFGVGAYYGTEAVTGVGQHSQILDEFARYGIFGAIPLMIFLYLNIKRLWKALYIQDRKNIMLISTIIFLILAFLNPVFNDGILMCYFIIVPLLGYGEKKYENMLYN